MISKYTRAFIDDIHDETVRLRSLYDDFSINGQGIECLIGNCDAKQRNKWLVYLHAPLSKVMKRAPTDDERHYLFGVIFGRTIFSADDISNLEAIAWHHLVGNDKNAAFARAMIEDVLSERTTATV